MHRYALYYVPPPGTALAAFGARWLGRDACAPPEGAGVSAEDWRRAVATPRRYGFHATLKAPFRLAEGKDERTLGEALERFCRARGPAPVGKLALRVLSDFLVLAPLDPRAGAALAADCVSAFDSFRAPSTAAEIARRRPDRLTASQKAKLERWGYPYVFEDYRFHLSLTGPLESGDRARFGAHIARMALAAIAEPVEIAEICLCGQTSPDADFVVLARFALGRPPQR
ncbi:MAG: DUF1045 domain-containing protein [Defluviicoccus sp.]|nr:DUF1045 domain-containing protein [Defluviicoccus sp.]MDE0383868.1 DUF1045 domain-containing protein [Defluviicoccus sp.]